MSGCLEGLRRLGNAHYFLGGNFANILSMSLSRFLVLFFADLLERFSRDAPRHSRSFDLPLKISTTSIPTGWFVVVTVDSPNPPPAQPPHPQRPPQPPRPL